jgi:undecaprenyl-diphosphatase
MSVWESLILGIVQGATEFLPVSSSGHLVIVQTMLGVRLPGVLFEVAVHVATLVSILMVYRKRVTSLAGGVITRDPDAIRYVLLLVVATLPAALLGVFGKDFIEGLFDAPATPGVALLVTGGFLWTSRGAIKRAVNERPGWVAAFLIGVAQACALVPGISRAGATVVAALWLGIRAREAAAFSFLMAVPAIAGAGVLQIPEVQGGVADIGAVPLLVGSVAAAITGVLAIRTFVAVLARESFHFFAPYCWAVGAAFLLYLTLS